MTGDKQMISYQRRGAGPLPRRRVLGLLGSIPVAAGTVAATGCSAEASTAGYTQPSVPSPVPPSKTLQPGGTYDRQLARLAAQDQFSGTVLLTYRDKPVLARAYRMADKEKGVPNQLDTIFALASVTKLFTAVAVIQLLEQGKVGLDRTLGTYLDGFPPHVAGTVTVHQLLTHTSGMGDFLGSPAYQRQHLAWTSAAQVMDGIMAIVKQSPLLFTPGTRYSYSNSGYATLGSVVARASGQSYYDYVRDHVFARADMTRSGFYTKTQWLTNPGIARPYSASAPGGKGTAQPGGQLTDVISGEDFIGSPAGNAFSTVLDMARFAGALTGGRLLSPAYASLMTSGKVPLPPQRIPSELNMAGYGPDIRIVNNQIIVGHTGGAVGETADIDIYPGRDWVAVILSNYDSSNQVGSLIKLQDQLITGHPE
jgi:CubicO group peptidase (beta-lactamase class C family)